MALPLKELVKLKQIVERVQNGKFDQNDIESLLIKLRPYSSTKRTFLEIAHFVAHPDARNRGIAQESMTAFSDSVLFFTEYTTTGKQIDLLNGFPGYVYRLLLSQTHLAEESQLKSRFKMGRETLKNKIKSKFALDNKTDVCTLRTNKGGMEFIAALQYVMGFIHSRHAFHINDFHLDLRSLLHSENLNFDESKWRDQEDRISLSILCLISNTIFDLKNCASASCEIGTENHFRILQGRRKLPTGNESSEPNSYGNLAIHGKATIKTPNGFLTNVFPVVATDLNPHDHCDQSLFAQENTTNEFGDYWIETIKWAPDMSMSESYKLIRADSIL